MVAALAHQVLLLDAVRGRVLLEQAVELARHVEDALGHGGNEKE